MAREERFLKVPAGMWEMLFRLIDSWVRLEFGDTVIVIVMVIPQLYSRLQYSIIYWNIVEVVNFLYIYSYFFLALCTFYSSPERNTKRRLEETSIRTLMKTHWGTHLMIH